MRFFYELDRDKSRPLVLWGAGQNGKDMAKILQSKGDSFHWVCDNERKIGKDIYNVRMEHFEAVKSMNSPQIIIVVASPTGKKEIEDHLAVWEKKPVLDYWFFA